MLKTCAVTGGTGFLGARIIDLLLARGVRVQAFARDPKRLKSAHELLTPTPGALEDPAALAALCQGADAVIHCAGLTHARRDAEFDAVNAVGAQDVAAAALAAGARHVLISSIAARHPEVSPYAASKRRGEELTRDATKGRFVALRAPAIYGPGDEASLPLFRMVKGGFAPAPAGHPPPRASILYVDDVAAAAVAAAEGGTDFGVYDIGDGRPEGHTWREIGEALGAALGVRARMVEAPRAVLSAYAVLAAGAARTFGGAPFITPGKVREFFHPDWTARDNLFERASDWSPRTPLKEGFQKTVLWYKERGWL